MGIKSIMIIGAVVAATAAHAADAQPKITVYLREKTHIPVEVRFPAKVMATRMFARIGVILEWGMGKTAREPSQPSIFIDVMADTPSDRMPGALAYALPYEGIHITVFYDRIQRAEYPSMLLAHVMVHEIAHLLQGIQRHSDAGIMKAHWSATECGGMRLAALPFLQQDVDLIYAGLARRASKGGVVIAGRQ